MRISVRKPRARPDALDHCKVQWILGCGFLSDELAEGGLGWERADEEVVLC